MAKKQGKRCIGRREAAAAASAAPPTWAPGLDLGPGLYRVRLGPGPNKTQAKINLKKMYGCFNICANFMEGTIEAKLITLFTHFPSNKSIRPHICVCN